MFCWRREVWLFRSYSWKASISLKASNLARFYSTSPLLSSAATKTQSGKLWIIEALIYKQMKYLLGSRKHTRIPEKPRIPYPIDGMTLSTKLVCKDPSSVLPQTPPPKVWALENQLAAKWHLQLISTTLHHHSPSGTLSRYAHADICPDSDGDTLSQVQQADVALEPQHLSRHYSTATLTCTAWKCQY